MNKVDYGSEKPRIINYRDGYLIPIGVEELNHETPAGTKYTTYKAYQVYVKSFNKEELDSSFGELKERFPDDYINAAWHPIREKRNLLLNKSDWTQVPDSPVDKESWSNYRQQLRDICNSGNPFEVNWPTKP